MNWQKRNIILYIGIVLIATVAYWLGTKTTASRGLNTDDRYWRGFSHKMNGNNHSAMRDLTRALKIKPDFEAAKKLMEELL